MVRRALFALLVVSAGFGTSTEAADVPFSVRAKAPKAVHTSVVRKKPVVVATKSHPVKVAEKQIIAVPADVDVDRAPETDLAAVEPQKIAPPQELSLSWFLSDLVANADGPKGEGSASIEGNLVVAEPGYVSSPYMVIELSGHIVKTPSTTVRLDVKIGTVEKTVSWTSDEVKSGRFSVSLNAPMKAGKLPGYFPVSAIALVSREGKQGVAMVSLESIQVRLGKVSQVAAKQ